MQTRGLTLDQYRLWAPPGDTGDAGSSEVSEHLALGLTAAQSADRIAQKFAEISHKFPALRMEDLPSRVFQNMEDS